MSRNLHMQLKRKNEKKRLFKFYKELGGEVTEELSEITGYIEHSRRIDKLFVDD